MAPELKAGAKHNLGACDVYSLGRIMIQMFTQLRLDAYSDLQTELIKFQVGPTNLGTIFWPAASSACMQLLLPCRAPQHPWPSVGNGHRCFNGVKPAGSRQSVLPTVLSHMGQQGWW